MPTMVPYPCFNPRHAEIFAFTVKKLERLGVSGVVIEDKPPGGHGTHLALSQRWDISMEGNQKTHGIYGILPSNYCWLHKILGQKIVEVPRKWFWCLHLELFTMGLKDFKGNPEVGCFCPPNWVRCHKGTSPIKLGDQDEPMMGEIDRVRQEWDTSSIDGFSPKTWGPQDL